MSLINKTHSFFFRGKYSATFLVFSLYKLIVMQLALDQTLINKSLSGDLESYGELINQYQKAVYNVCYRITGNKQDAEDISQETFIRAYKYLNNFDNEKPFGPWIKKIAANLSLNAIKSKESTHVFLDEKVISSKSNNPEKEISKQENQEIIHQAIISLSPKQRTVIELRHYQDLSYKEISEALNIPITDVKSHLFRGRRKLAKKLKEYE